jgi:hypothetical protein
MRFNFVADVSRRNPVLSLAISPALPLSAAVWTAPVSTTILDARIICLTHALQNLTAQLPNGELWLIAAHKTLQPDNRISRYNGLWKSLQKAGAIVPSGEFIDESVLPFGNSIRVFGAVRCNWNQPEAINSILSTAQSALVILPRKQAENTLKTLVQHGWPVMNSKPPEEIVEAVCTQSGLVMEVYGEFDDPEVCVAAIGKEKVLNKLEFKP